MDYSENCVKLILKTRPLYLEKTKIWNNHYYIGYFHLITIGYKKETISKKEAKLLLEKDLKNISKQLTKHLTITLNQNKFDALVSLAYDIGIKTFITDEILDLINKSNFDSTRVRFRHFNKYMKKPIYQLIKTRKLELKLFDTKEEDTTPNE